MSIKFNFQTNAQTDHHSFSNEYLIDRLEKFKASIDSPKNGFFHYTDNLDRLTPVKELAVKFQSKKHFVQIGIGGSALGPQMLLSALKPTTEKTFTLLDNIDSDYIHDELEKIDLTQALFYVVSKSGGTAETVACFSLVRNMLFAKGIKEEELNKFFVFCTDPTSGQLRKFVTKYNFESLEVPSNIGGRYSVLTHVGLFPACFMGINIDKIFKGANDLKPQILDTDAKKNPLLQAAAHTAYLYLEEELRVDQTVLMPYSSKLRNFSFWFVQLWAESLGKFSEVKNKSMGLTPIPAYGATDQHSQMQLFMEGPNNKLMILLDIEKREHNYELDSELKMESAQNLAPFTLNELMEAEFKGTLQALKDNKRNLIRISLDCLSPENIGALVLYFESLTTVMGEYLFINPFDQPGVEKSKVYAYEFLRSLEKSTDK
jgi:glucose-6-phosphate isomerase